MSKTITNEQLYNELTEFCKNREIKVSELFDRLLPDILNNQIQLPIHEHPVYEQLSRKIYDQVRYGNVCIDTISYGEQNDVEVTTPEAKRVAKLWTDGKYDCDLSYWENIKMLIDTVKCK